jgi:endonuclease IV
MMHFYLDKEGDYYFIYKYRDTPSFSYNNLPDEEVVDIEKYALKILKECKTLSDYEKCFRSGRTTDTSRKWTKKRMKEMLEMMFKASAKESISFSVLISIEQGTSFGELKELIDNFAKAGCLRVVIDYESPWTNRF